MESGAGHILIKTMPKKINNLYSRIVSFDNLLAAYQECRKGKRYSIQALDFATHLEENLINIHNHLIWKTWTTGKAHRFVVREPKIREITAPPFADRVVHHAIMQVCAPLFERRFIENSFACRQGKGAQAAVNKLQQFMRDTPTPAYAVKADVKKCFYSLRHDNLMQAVGRVIACKDTLNLFRTVFAGYGNDDGIGLPIGALTSQWACNLLLDKIDHAMTDKHGYGRYVRYMDDVIMLVENKAQAKRCLSLFESELNAIGLELNPKSGVFPVSQGIDFVGYRTFATHILPRKRIIKKARKDIARTPTSYQRIDSFLAYCKHCNSHNTVTNILYQLIPGVASGNY